MNNEEKILALLEKMDNRLGNVESRLENMDTRMGNLENGQDILAKQVITLTEDVQKIRQSQVRMENEFTDKVRGLYDAQEVQMDYFSSIKNTLARLENGQENIIFMVSRLESKQEDQDRELRLLRIEHK